MLRRLQEQNYYQVLEVSPDASSNEIQAAFESARDMYNHEALVTSSILSDSERRKTFEVISEAYQTLIAEESRRLYDAQLGLPPREPSNVERPAEVPRAKALSSEPSPEAPSRTLSVVESPEAEPEPTEAPPRPVRRQSPIQLGDSEEASGEFLRRAREALGLELATISEETKIGRSMLEYIEAERRDRLPAPVYLRNFTRQIATCLGLDEELVSRTYLERIRRLSDGS